MGYIACFGGGPSPDVKEPALLTLFNNSARIVLPVKGSDNFKFVFKALSLKRFGEGCILATAWSENAFLLINSGNRWRYNGRGTSKIYVNMSESGYDELELTNSYMKVNGTTYNLSSVTSHDSYFKILGYNNGELCAASIGIVDIYIDDVLTYKMEPRKVNGVCGLYDTINNVFYAPEAGSFADVIYIDS